MRVIPEVQFGSFAGPWTAGARAAGSWEMVTYVSNRSLTFARFLWYDLYYPRHMSEVPSRSAGGCLTKLIRSAYVRTGYCHLFRAVPVTVFARIGYAAALTMKPEGESIEHLFENFGVSPLPRITQRRGKS